MGLVQRSGRIGVRWGGWLALAAVLVLAFVYAPLSEARLRPYYVVRGAAFGQVHPRVLFVLDTSGSMAQEHDGEDELCQWNACETEGVAGQESRISVARRAIHQTVAAAGTATSFGLMTFDKVGPHDPAAGVPEHCDGGTDAQRRFTWVTDYDAGPIERYGSQLGAWRLCQGEVVAPYPYLRWDELGIGSVITSNAQTGDLPPSPLISAATMADPVNSHRRVQWFPKFMGVRVQLNDVTDPDRSVTSQTIGDWATTDGEREAKVRYHDFYYWPYVDGFPGYYQFNVTPMSTGQDRAGVVGDDSGVAAAQLYAPLYLDLAQSAMPLADRGPSARAAANNAVLDFTSPAIRGGVDVGGPAPWSSAIGALSGSVVTSNAADGRASVASYLQFVAQSPAADVCAPTSVVLVVDAEPTDDEGGAVLYQRLAALRQQLGTRVYVVGISGGATAINDMACAGAGACDGAGCASPCSDLPANGWDTCADPQNPDAACVYAPVGEAALVQTLGQIVDEAVNMTIVAGPPATMVEFGLGAEGKPGQGQIAQTQISAYTEFPSWRGHVVRSLCDDRDADGNLLAHCVEPVPAFDRVQETFGPCPQSRSWDAGACLRDTNWHDRRLYTNTADHQVIAIAQADGHATGEFRSQLEQLGLLVSDDHAAEADRIVRFLAGAEADEPEGDRWKLAGVANSVPVVVRRVPRHHSERVPEVPLLDPHCAGRLYGEIEAGALPTSLRDFARSAWDDRGILDAPSPHYEFQEAVLVGDDMGILHAFQLDSGNELWGFVPRELLANAVVEAMNGWPRMGQPAAGDEHIYGIAATVNHAFAYDAREPNPRWRDVAIFGFGGGGQEFYGLDVSHMSPVSPRGGIEVLWTSEDAGLKGNYDRFNGQTWARPAISYRVPNDSLAFEPQAVAVLGSGYAVGDGAPTEQGRTLMFADAVTGEILESAELPALTDPTFESSFGALVDPAVGSHCLSRYWAEIQETYIADPAGRLFRWDLGRDSHHAADSAGLWGTLARPVARFAACEGVGPTCTVEPGHRGDVFSLAPAVSASNRIDEFGDMAGGNITDERDQFLVALVSGSLDDDSIDGGDPDNPFHSSLYLLVDDHRSGDQGQGFAIPDGAPLSPDPAVGSAVGNHPSYFRVALSQLERTRTVVPYDGAAPIVETRSFSKAARPVRAPRILVTGVVDRVEGQPDAILEGIEVYYIDYTIYEPASQQCDPRFYDSGAKAWHFDQGSTYQVRFRLTADLHSGFNFATGATGGGADFGGGFARGLVLESISQVTTAACAGGNCGAVPISATSRPCDRNGAVAGPSQRGFAVPTYLTEVPGFRTVE